jgi:hypothetical protein
LFGKAGRFMDILPLAKSQRQFKRVIFVQKPLYPCKIRGSIEKNRRIDWIQQSFTFNLGSIYR